MTATWLSMLRSPAPLCIIPQCGRSPDPDGSEPTFLITVRPNQHVSPSCWPVESRRVLSFDFLERAVHIFGDDFDQVTKQRRASGRVWRKVVAENCHLRSGIQQKAPRENRVSRRARSPSCLIGNQKLHANQPSEAVLFPDTAKMLPEELTQSI